MILSNRKDKLTAVLLADVTKLVLAQPGVTNSFADLLYMSSILNRCGKISFYTLPFQNQQRSGIDPGR
jgi:hypothetical protein